MRNSWPALFLAFICLLAIPSSLLAQCAEISSLAGTFRKIVSPALDSPDAQFFGYVTDTTFGIGVVESDGMITDIQSYEKGQDVQISLSIDGGRLYAASSRIVGSNTFQLHSSPELSTVRVFELATGKELTGEAFDTHLEDNVPTLSSYPYFEAPAQSYPLSPWENAYCSSPGIPTQLGRKIAVSGGTTYTTNYIEFGADFCAPPLNPFGVTSADQAWWGSVNPGLQKHLSSGASEALPLPALQFEGSLKEKQATLERWREIVANGDTVVASADLSSGAPNIPNMGAVFVFDFSGTGELREVFSGYIKDSESGYSLAYLGKDANGDDQFAIGAPGHADTSVMEPVIPEEALPFLHLETGTVVILTIPASGEIDANISLGGENDGDRYGHAIAPLGDLNGDGSVDMLIGSLANYVKLDSLSTNAPYSRIEGGPDFGHAVGSVSQDSSGVASHLLIADNNALYTYPAVQCMLNTPTDPGTPGGGGSIDDTNGPDKKCFDESLDESWYGHWFLMRSWLKTVKNKAKLKHDPYGFVNAVLYTNLFADVFTSGDYIPPQCKKGKKLNNRLNKKWPKIEAKRKLLETRFQLYSEAHDTWKADPTPANKKAKKQALKKYKKTSKGLLKDTK